MPHVRRAPVLVCLALLLHAGALSPARAQQTAPDPSSTPRADDTRPQPAEPDFRLINLPTTLRLPMRASNFEMSHRFLGNLRDGSFGDHLGDLFGLDQGAWISLGYRYGVYRHVQAAIQRSSLGKTIQFSGKWDPMHQSGSHPVSLSLVASIEGLDNFREERQPAVSAIVSRVVADRLAFYVTPAWVHNTGVDLDETRDTLFLGVGGRARIGRRTFASFEVAPRLAGYAPGDAVFGVAVEKRVGGHVFQLNLTNSPATTTGQIARGGPPRSLHLGFNLSRKFF